MLLKRTLTFQLTLSIIFFPYKVLNFLTHVEKYLSTEIRHGAIIGPFDTPPLGGLHCSPMLTREKNNSVNRRVIVDLSWPHHNSVNSHVSVDSYLGTTFELSFPTVDNIVE